CERVERARARARVRCGWVGRRFHRLYLSLSLSLPLFYFFFFSFSHEVDVDGQAGDIPRGPRGDGEREGKGRRHRPPAAPRRARGGVGLLEGGVGRVGLEHPCHRLLRRQDQGRPVARVETVPVNRGSARRFRSVEVTTLCRRLH
ncbi:MAG: hypothetical protein BJ554DRAFT_7170, partial [Olpidium bornovanus]